MPRGGPAPGSPVLCSLSPSGGPRRNQSIAPSGATQSRGGLKPQRPGNLVKPVGLGERLKGPESPCRTAVTSSGGRGG
ncbi:unnamed protein product [Gulo gulo]|uniref:Uncharacterized protein n=1 Tax=Gulo gulo TaxID=48420 RepID=A0A9X9LXW9_GULGU|nr:unnamed protein product [Gulo gulo]